MYVLTTQQGYVYTLKLYSTHTPELGFQSYTLLEGDISYREAQKSAFLANKIVNPELDYPKLDPAVLRAGIQQLDTILSFADTQGDGLIRDTIWDSAAYRMAEHYWLLTLKRLHDNYPAMGEDQLDDQIRYIQTLNEQLYSQPDAGVSRAVINEVDAQIAAKPLNSLGQTLRSELQFGTFIEAGDQIVKLDPIYPRGLDRLPDFPTDMMHSLRDKLLKDNLDIVKLVDEYWHDIILSRPLNEQIFYPRDMARLFKQVHALRDPANTSGVSIKLNDDGTNLSWESPDMAVVIGMHREPIQKPNVMLAKIIHEYVVHAGRSIYGSRTGLPVLGTGLFTDADPPEVSDYLTFEEGFASICEAAILGEPDTWKPANLEKTLAIVLAYEGRDFRQTFEALWRIRALMTANDKTPLDDKLINKAKQLSYASLVRIFRGTPTTLPRQNSRKEKRVLTYNKDLAYLSGKLLMMDFWRRYGQDQAMIDLLFKAKFDPTNARQLTIVKKFVT